MTLNNLTAAGMKLAAELSRLGSMYKNKYGDAWGRLGQKLTEVESVRNQLVTNITTRFTSPMTKLLSNEKKTFATNEKKIKTTLANYEGEIEKLITALDKEQPAGTDRMLFNLSALSKKVTEFDNVNADLLRDLQQSQQKQYIEWSEHWHTVVTSQLEFHTAMEAKLVALQPLWSAGDAKSSGSSSNSVAPSSPAVAPAAAAAGGDDDHPTTTTKKKSKADKVAAEEDAGAKPNAAAPAPAAPVR